MSYKFRAKFDRRLESKEMRRRDIRTLFFSRKNNLGNLVTFFQRPNKEEVEKRGLEDLQNPVISTLSPRPISKSVMDVVFSVKSGGTLDKCLRDFLAA